MDELVGTGEEGVNQAAPVSFGTEPCDAGLCALEG